MGVPAGVVRTLAPLPPRPLRLRPQPLLSRAGGRRADRILAVPQGLCRPRGLGRAPRRPPEVAAARAGPRRGESHRRDAAVRARGHAGAESVRHLREEALMSRLRAKCPDCHTFTAVALGPGYECHACGREFGAGMVRVPRAWGDGGEAMAEAARLPLPYPETAIVEEGSLREQSLAIALDLPERPLILGGCCCSHVGAVEALAARHGRIAVVWLDAHGDLNTAETSPSGNLWGMPLRMLVDSGAVASEDVALVCDSLEATAVTSFMPEPEGLEVREVERLFGEIAESSTVLGMGLSGLAPEERNIAPLSRLCTALGL